MHAKSDSSSPPDKLLYSYQKALDETVKHGASPRRLFRVLYPIRALVVQGRQRVSTDMEEIQWFIERAIQQADLTAPEELELFFGLDNKAIRAMLSFLEKIGHLVRVSGRLKLTKLGEESVAHHVSFQERDTQFKLYFDAFGNRPLRQEHYRIRFYENLPEQPGYWIFPPWFRQWDADSLTELIRRKDRSHYGVMDEISSISPTTEESILYMPVHVVERQVDVEETADLPVYLVFNTLPGYRDTELELSINQDLIILDWLRSTSADLLDALGKRLDMFGLGSKDYRIEQDPVWGIKVFIDPAVISRQDGKSFSGGANQRITINHIGRYLLASEWCVLLTCDDYTIRQEAGVQDCLEMLEFSYSDPSLDDVRRSISMVNRRLNLPTDISVNMLFEEANRRKMDRAASRLEEF